MAWKPKKKTGELTDQEIGMCLAQTREKAWALAIKNVDSSVDMNTVILNYKALVMKLWPVERALIMCVPGFSGSVTEDEIKTLQKQEMESVLKQGGL